MSCVGSGAAISRSQLLSGGGGGQGEGAPQPGRWVPRCGEQRAATFVSTGASSQISTRVCRAAAAQSDCTFFGGQGLLLMGRERFPNVDEVQIANQRSIRGEAELELFGRVVLV